MSRCFPYPPPGYSRNGATYEALIESIKLQKETDKAKAERKKEKRARKEKKDKEKRKDEVKGKSLKNANDGQPDADKVLQSSVDLKEAHNRREPSIEQLEKSDLTEEHCQPVRSHKPSYSSDSTQNSNKRKRDDDAVFPGGVGGHGKPIKIRLLKKHQGSDSSKETLCSNSGRTDPTSVCGADARVNTWKISSYGSTDPSVPSASNSVHGLNSKDRTLFVSSNRKTGLQAPLEANNNVIHGIHSSRKQPAPISGRPVLPASHLKYDMPSANSNKVELSTSSGSKRSDVQGFHFSGEQQAPMSGRPILSSTSNETELPAPSGSRSDVQWLHPSRKQSTPSSGRPILPPNQPRSNSDKTVLPGQSGSRKNDIQGLHSGSKQSAPSFVRQVLPPGHVPNASPPLAPSINAEKKPGSNDVGPTRYEKKMQKKHAKYEKLMGSWVPPVLQAHLSCDDDDQDWLSRSYKTCHRSSRDDAETCREVAACSLWRPCAQFLAEADTYALPYTVPF